MSFFVIPQAVNLAATLIGPTRLSIFDIFRHKRFDDARRGKFVDMVSGILEVQVTVSGRNEISTLATEEGAMALGYVYGFVDAALRAAGQDMSDMSVGVPITFQVLRRGFPGDEEKCVEYLAENIGKNQRLMRGMMVGGQQYLDFMSGKLRAPMDLARYLIEHEVSTSGGSDGKWDAVLNKCDLEMARDEIADMHKTLKRSS